MKKEQSFEKALGRLTEVVEALENEGTSLADAMRLYEEGIQLASDCRKQLERAELRITELRARAEGTLSEEDIEV